MPAKALRSLSLDEAKAAISEAQRDEALANQQFIDGDHWQNGDGWVGPRPSATDTSSAIVLAEIQKAFTSCNTILEVCERHSSGVVGREPAWGLTVQRELDDDEAPTEAEQALIDEAEALLTRWWNKHGVHGLMRDFTTTCLHQERSLLRLFVPNGRMTDGQATVDGKPVRVKVASAGSIEDALALIHIDSPHPISAAVLKDPDSLEPVSLHSFDIDDKQYVDIGYVDGDATVLRRVGTGADTSFRLSLGGRLLMHQLERSLLITKQVQQQQRALNLAESMVPRNVVTAGFLERIILNAQMPGTWVDDDTAETGKRFVPANMHFGAGMTNFIAGKKYSDREGNEAITSPTAVFREPVDPAPTVAAKKAHYESILNEVDQLHHLISGDAAASAVSRVEARMDFKASLTKTQAPLQEAGRWLIETVLAFAEAISGKVGYFTNTLRADFNCRLQVGHLTSDEQEALATLVEQGLIDREEAMSLLGVDDVDAALARINDQPLAMLALREKQAQVFTLWVTAGLDFKVAALLAGIDKDSEEYKALIAMDPTTGRGGDDDEREKETQPGGRPPAPAAAA